MTLVRNLEQEQLRGKRIERDRGKERREARQAIQRLTEPGTTTGQNCQEREKNGRGAILRGGEEGWWRGKGWDSLDRRSAGQGKRGRNRPLLGWYPPIGARTGPQDNRHLAGRSIKHWIPRGEQEVARAQGFHV